MKKFSFAGLLSAVLLFPEIGSAQQGNQQPNVPAAAQQAEDAVERAVRRFRIGVQGGVGLDPEPQALLTVNLGKQVERLPPL